MPGSASTGFIRFSENLKRVRSLQSEIEVETALRRENFRASLLADALPAANNLSSAYAKSRARTPGGGQSH